MPSYLSVAQQVARINRDLNRVADACEEEVFGTLLTQAALVAAEMRAVAPVSHDRVPGQLRDSIRVDKSEKKARTVLVEAGGKETLRRVENGKAGFAYTYDYVRAAEYGTEDAPAHPFFWPIWRARRKGVRAATRKAVKNAVRTVFK